MIKYVGKDLAYKGSKNYRYIDKISMLDDYIFEALNKNINVLYPDSNNLIVYGSLFGPQFPTGYYKEALALDTKFDNMFLVSAGEPWCILGDAYDEFIDQMGIDNVIKIGNFADINPKLYFNFTWGIYSARVWGHNYKVEDLILKDIKYKFINYNRSPKEYRTTLVNMITDAGLEKCGIITLGDENWKSVLPVLDEDLDEITHCLDRRQPLKDGDIPNDNSSLGTMNYWNHHFLNVVSETSFWWWDEPFITEKTAKPILGLRPFIINGNWKTYKWLRDNGFRTFEKYFPFAQFEDLHEDEVHPNIIKVLKWIEAQPNEVLLEMYNDMLPDLIHNRNRMFEFSEEEVQRIKNILLP